MAFFRKKKQGDVRQKLQQQPNSKQQPQPQYRSGAAHQDEAYTAESIVTILAAQPTSSSLVSPPSEDSISISSSVGQKKLLRRSRRQNSANDSSPSARGSSRDRRGTSLGRASNNNCNGKKTPLTTETIGSSSSHHHHHNHSSALVTALFGNHQLHPHNNNSSRNNHYNSNSSTSILLNSLNIVATDDIEITTYESQQALVEQREAIRRQLFDPPSTNYQQQRRDTTTTSNTNTNTSSPTSFLKKQQQLYGSSGRTILYRTATNASQEILPNGSIIPDNTPLPSSYYRGNKLSSPSTEQFSLPLSYVTQSFGSSSNGTDNNNINVEDINDYSTSRIVPIELVARSYDDSTEKNNSKKTSLSSTSSPSSPDVTMITRARTDPQRDRSTPPNDRSTSLSPSASLPLTPITTPTTAAAAAAAAANNTSTGTLPMDERQVDQELAYQRNRGKSPLKGLPDDERREYQRDEINANLVEVQDEDHNEEDEENGSNEEGEDDDDEGEEVSEISEMAPTVMSKNKLGLLGRGALVTAAAIGWGASAFDSACFGEEDDLLDDATEREVPTLSSSNHTQQQEKQQRQHTNARPVYLNETECKKFLRRITRNGFVLLNLVVNEESSWTGRTVTMCIAKGSQEHPAQLEWTTVTGGLNHEIAVSSVSLMDILTIDSDGIPDDQQDDPANATTDNGCIFTITTDDGHVFLFEANSTEERDRIVHGLKTIIARWARQMVAGDVTATTELYSSHQPPEVFAGRNTELALSPNPTYTMNRLAHRLLDL